MKLNKAKIKRPKFLLSYFVSVLVLLLVFAVLSAFYVMFLLVDYQQEVDFDEENYSLSNYTPDIDNPTAEDLAAIKWSLLDHYCSTGENVILNAYRHKTDHSADYNKFLFSVDTSRTALLAYNEDHVVHYLTLADDSYLKYFDSPEVKAYEFLDTGNDITLPKKPMIVFRCRDFYVNYENATFIPAEIEIMKTVQRRYGDPENTGLIIKIEPGNLEGYKHVTPRSDKVWEDDGLVQYGAVAGCAEFLGIDWTENAWTGYWNDEMVVEICHTGLNHIPFQELYKDKLQIVIYCIIVGAFIFAFVPSTINYNIKLRRFKIFEYRSKMIDAMAHDLKTPMAAITAYAENLSNHIGTDKQEYYAGKIEDKVAQMNKMVNDILEFSKSENNPAKITKEDLDIADVIEKIIADNEHTISERSLKINYDKKSMTVKTDEKIFEQAISNLINNAVLYCKEGTEIGIACEDKKIVITNITTGKIDDVKSLKNPFTKGDSARKNNGTGLGLAIADNNLAILGYKLYITTDEDKFIATVKM